MLILFFVFLKTNLQLKSRKGKRKKAKANKSKTATSTNDRGDKGSPCITPRLHMKWLPGTPFKSIDEESEESSLWTQPTQSFFVARPTWNLLSSALQHCSEIRTLQLTCNKQISLFCFSQMKEHIDFKLCRSNKLYNFNVWKKFQIFWIDINIQNEDFFFFFKNNF